MIPHVVASTDGNQFAQMQTKRKRKMRKNANTTASDAFFRLGVQLAASPTPQAFAWVALLLCRSGELGGLPSEAADYIQSILLDGGG